LTGITRSDKTREKVSKNHADVSGSNNPRAKKIQCVETGETFNTIQEAMQWCGLKSHQTIPNYLRGIQKYAGKHPVTKEKLH